MDKYGQTICSMSIAERLAIVAALALIAASILRIWATFTLMHRYRVDEYLATSQARRLYRTAQFTPLVACAAVLALAWITRIWWVEAPAAIFALVVAVKTGWAVRVRLSAAYAGYDR
jgi:hypothetical protein